ncbi:MAG: transposase [Chloroflexota bacterium]
MGAKTRPPYPAACGAEVVQAEAVQLVRSGGRSLTQAAKELDLHHETLRGWVRQTAIEEGRPDGLTTEERTEGARLRREGRLLVLLR